MAKKKKAQVLDEAQAQDVPKQELAAKEPAKASNSLKVRAKMTGYYDNQRRRPGDVFYLKPFTRVKKVHNKVTRADDEVSNFITANDQFSEEWMELADQNEKLYSQKPQKSFGKHNMEEHQVGVARAAHEPREEQAPGTGDMDVL